MPELSAVPKSPENLVAELRRLITNARRQAALAVNSALTLLYWRIGDRIRREVLGEQRAGYGEQILATLSQELAGEFGRGFEFTNLTRMVKFAEAFPDESIIATLSQQLSWSHFRELLPLKQPLQRKFYAEMCRLEGWSVRTLRGRIDSMLYERTALSRKPAELARLELDALRAKGDLGPALVLKDPYILDFLDLRGNGSNFGALPDRRDAADGPEEHPLRGTVSLAVVTGLVTGLVHQLPTAKAGCR